MIRVISFKIWGDFAHFRRHYTTSSPLTHSLPPPSALRGIVGAIIGLSREEYPQLLSFEKAVFGIRLLVPLKKIRLGLNLMDTKDGSWTILDLKKLKPTIKQGRLHTQVRTEFLKDPVFEIFFHHEDKNIMDEFANRLQLHSCVYTPYLGITECLANFVFLWDRTVQRCTGISKVVSAFKASSLKDIKLESTTGVIKERIPLFINADRIREQSEEIVFNPQAQPITALVENAYFYPGQENLTFAFVG